MARYNVLVTGVGAIIGYGIVRSLRLSRYDLNIVGIDVYRDAVGQQWCDTFIQGIWAADAEYCSFLTEVMRKHDIHLVCFGIEDEIHRVCEDREKFRGDWGRLVLNRRELIELSRDKWRFHEHLTLNNMKSIGTLIAGNYDFAVERLGLPCLIKPRYSTASKGIAIVHSKNDFCYWKNKLGKEFLVQEIVGDDEHEYTVGVFGLGDGTFSQSITFLRKLGRDGSTVKAQTVSIPELDVEVRRLTALLKPVGPTNIQFRQHKGDYLPLEVNPRFSSSLSIRTAFGFNEPEMCLEYFVEKVPPRPAITKQGTAVRYIEDLVSYR